MIRSFEYTCILDVTCGGELFGRIEKSQDVSSDLLNILIALLNGFMATTNWRDLPRDTPIDRLEVLRSIRGPHETGGIDVGVSLCSSVVKATCLYFKHKDTFKTSVKS
ncbi:hypothetical protein Tco_1129079 [Tanacetum coccineum]